MTASGEPGPLRGALTLPRATSVWPGSLLAGRYRVIGRIAGGSMGQIYRATQEPGGREVAIKVLSVDLDGNEERFRKRFAREAAVVAQLAHPNIIAVYDYGTTDAGDVFMATEYLPGAPLSELLRMIGPLPVPRALAIAIQITRALRKAHAQGVVHRDLKPANIMVRPDEDGLDFVKVLDFGLVKLFAPDHSEVDGVFTDESLTAAGALMGTPGYMAPEQAVGETIDARADLYSLGVLLFQMLTGRLPFEQEGLVELVTAQVLQPVPTLQEVAPELVVPEALEQIMRRCLDRHRNLRYQSTDELLSALKTVWRLETDESYGTETFSIPNLPILLAPAPDAEEPQPSPDRAVFDPLASSEQAALAEPSTLIIEPLPARRSSWWAALAVVLMVVAMILTGLVYHRATEPAPARPERAGTQAPVGDYKDNPY